MPTSPTLFHLLQAAAAERPAALALIDGERHVSYGDYLSSANGFARALDSAGVQSGDRVAIVLPNSVELCFAVLGVAAVGATAFLINPRSASDELCYALADCDPAAVVGTDERIAAGRPFFLADAFPAPSDGARGAAGRSDQAAIVIYTSGTTGRPKGAMLSHKNVLCSVAGYAKRLEISPQDRVSAFTPMCHAGGMINGALTALWGRCTAVLANGLSPRAALDLLGDAQVSVYLAVPTMLITQLQEGLPRERRLSSLRAIVSGGAPVQPELIRRATEFYGVRSFHVVYGLSEANMATLTEGNTTHHESVVGHPTEGFEVSVVDSDRRPVRTGKIGEVAIRGDGVFRGYWRAPEATAACLDAAGWLYTGDLGRLTSTGELSIVGRLKDMYIQGGTNVYPAEVERVLEQHPTVSIAAVVGRPDPVLGEVGCAFVIPSTGTTVDADDLLSFAKQRLAPFKCPREVRVRSNLPLTPFGKVQKAALRAELAAETGVV